jgi:hypothetical protein
MKPISNGIKIKMLNEIFLIINHGSSSKLDGIPMYALHPEKNKHIVKK